ncbi:hypothetical protein XFF1815_810030 [Xanthomonas citri pv. fuscans]|nr:hypothetical protein XFF1815_810030 [Xanthomonas citri pv. fuscans]
MFYLLQRDWTGEPASCRAALLRIPIPQSRSLKSRDWRFGFGIGRGGGPAPIYLAGPHVFTSYSVIGPVNPQVAAQRCCESRFPNPGH